MKDNYYCEADSHSGGQKFPDFNESEISLVCSQDQPLVYIPSQYNPEQKIFLSYAGDPTFSFISLKNQTYSHCFSIS
jgi:hypothetical protein